MVIEEQDKTMKALSEELTKIKKQLVEINSSLQQELNEKFKYREGFEKKQLECNQLKETLSKMGFDLTTYLVKAKELRPQPK